MGLYLSAHPRRECFHRPRWFLQRFHHFDRNSAGASAIRFAFNLRVVLAWMIGGADIHTCFRPALYEMNKGSLRGSRHATGDLVGNGVQGTLPHAKAAK